MHLKKIHEEKMIELIIMWIILITILITGIRKYFNNKIYSIKKENERVAKIKLNKICKKIEKDWRKKNE